MSELIRVVECASRKWLLLTNSPPPPHVSPLGQTASAVKYGGRLIAVQVPGLRRYDATKQATSSPSGDTSERVTCTRPSIH